MNFGLPQASVVGPGMFSYYTCQLGIIQKHNLKYHIYADDTHLLLNSILVYLETVSLHFLN